MTIFKCSYSPDICIVILILFMRSAITTLLMSLVPGIIKIELQFAEKLDGKKLKNGYMERTLPIIGASDK